MSTTTTDWEREVLRLKAETPEMTSAEIAERVGKHAGTVRKVIARATTETEDERDAAALNGNGNGHGPISTEDAERLRQAAEYGGEISRDPLPGQTGLADFIAEAGEAVGPMPPREMDGGEPVAETRLQGTRQLAIDFGPEADIPTGGTLVVKSEKLASGHFGLGDVITGTFTARITDAGGKERFDKDAEEFRAKPTAYVATITDLTVD